VDKGQKIMRINSRAGVGKLGMTSRNNGLDAGGERMGAKDRGQEIRS
jgi:hypothetical protein